MADSGSPRGASKRLVILAHYNGQDRVAEYVFQLASGLRKICDTLLVVSTSPVTGEELVRLEKLGRVICRSNVGYDFFSWKVGLEAAGPLDGFDEIVICNDSVYGPLFELAPAFEEMDRRDCDLWGMTSCPQFAFHLQSYFLVFRRKAIRSEFFQQFWEGVCVVENKDELIFRYEIGLSQAALEHGLKLDSFYRMQGRDRGRAAARNLVSVLWPWSVRLLGKGVAKGAPFSDSLLSDRVNPTQALWDRLIDAGMPFVKVEILRKNPHGIDRDEVLAKIRRDTRYDVGLIESHLERPAPRRVKNGVKKHPKVSVIVPSYNHSRFINTCLKAIDEQDYPEVEAIVIDDGSTDDSWSKIDSFEWSKGREVKKLRVENAGAHATINRGLRMATGDFLTICNSDDYFEAGRLTTLVGRLSESPTLLAFTKVRYVDDECRDVSKTVAFAKDLVDKQNKVLSFPTVGYSLILTNTAISTGNCFFRRQLIERIGVFRAYKYCHDWDFILRSLLVSEPMYVAEPLYSYRLHASNSFLRLQEAASRECPELMRRYLKAAVASPPENPLAPSPHHWPGYFDYFITSNTYQTYMTAWEAVDAPFFADRAENPKEAPRIPLST